MPDRETKPHVLTSEEFRRDRAKAIELAASGQTVVILGENQRPKTILVTPRDVQPMRFD